MRAKDHAERRDFIRMAVNAELRFGTCGGELSSKGHTRNLSATGIQFVTENEVQPGAELELEVLSENGRVPPLRAKVAVIRVDRSDDGLVVAAQMLEVR